MRTLRAGVEQSERQLELAAAFFALAVLFHNSDHLRRGAGDLPGDVFIAGTLAMVLEVGVVVLVFGRHRAAPLAAMTVGLSLAAGYVVVHFTPGRGWLSDSLLTTSMPLSILAAGLETMSGLLLGLVGAQIVRQRGLPAMGGPSALDREGLRHPIVIAMAVGNVLILAASVAQWVA